MSPNQDFDVAIVGGGPAGLSAALILGRALRKVIIFDHGNPRNAPSLSAQSVFTRDGIPPTELLKIARRQLEVYDVTIKNIEITDVRDHDDGFEIISATRTEANVRKVILSTGLEDIMPELPDIRQFWGKTVVHCPYCHGWELRNEPIAALVNAKSILNFAKLLTGWSNDLILLSNGPLDMEHEVQGHIESHGIQIEQDKITGLYGSGRNLEEIGFESGKTISRKALFIDPQQRLRSSLYQNLDLKYGDDGRLNTNRFGETGIPGIYVARDAGPNMQQISIAAASGAEVAIGINHKLLDEDFNVVK